MIVKTFCYIPGAALLIACWPSIAISQTVLSEQLNEVLRKHEAQLARLETLEASWSVVYDAADTTRTERWKTTVAPSYERSTRNGAGSEVQHLWNGSSFQRMIGFDPEEYASNPESIAEADGFLYHEDVSIHRPFQWRTLRAYRLYVNETDQSLRQLCEQSLREPELSTVDGLVQIQIVHPGLPQFNGTGTVSVPSGARILVELDPANGYLVQRYRTTFPLENGGGRFLQELSVQSFSKFPGSVFLPTHVKFLVKSGNHGGQQDLKFRYSSVNRPVETVEYLFVENLVVKEFESHSAPEPVGFYVAQQDGSLGEQFPSEVLASLVRHHRVSNPRGSVASYTALLFAMFGVGVASLCWVLIYKRSSPASCLLPIGIFAGAAILLWRMPERDEILRSQIATLNSAPDVRDVAPPIKAVNLQSGEYEEVEFLDRVTLLEFWATWCGPCQHSMEKLNELAGKKRDRWGDRVQLVSISVDQDREAAGTHLRTRGWFSTQTLIDMPISSSSPQGVSLPSVVARDYVITGVPTCLLINRRGEIVFRGNPTTIHLAEEIEQLMQD